MTTACPAVLMELVARDLPTVSPSLRILPLGSWEVGVDGDGVGGALVA
jgi:hypothetical protein